MTWRMANGIEELRKQLNAAFPKRSKASDGGIGDASHSSRSSDHNPNAQGVVCARDFTHDPKTGIDGQWLADQLVKHKDSRINYVIWNHKICSSTKEPWKWRRYSGVNAHTHHVHVSLIQKPTLYDSERPWVLDFPSNDDDDVATIVPSEPPPADEPDTDASDTASPAPLPDAAGATIQNADTIVNTGDAPVPVQDVTEPATVKTNLYQGTGLMGVLKKDFAAVGGGNISFQSLQEYATQASGWPPWVIGLITKLATAALVIGVLWLGYRLAHYVIWKIGEMRQQKLSAEINSDPTRKDLHWTGPGQTK